MASDFQRRKVAGVFAAMDVDGDGFLTEGDFVALATRWTTLHGVAPGSDQATRLREFMVGWWASLSSAAEDGETATLDDVMAVVDQLPAMADAVSGTADAMFEAIDINADGRISRTEYRRLVEAWTGRGTDTDAIFPSLDLDGDGHISRVEFRRLWSQFWVGDDPAEPGTFVFGRFENPRDTSRK